MTPEALARALLPVPAQPASDPLTQACAPPAGSDPGIACRLVWDFSHSTRAAELTKVFFAGPVHMALRVGFVLLLALIVRAGALRMISRITARAREDAGSRPDKARVLFRERRQQRANALDSVLRNAASVTIMSIAAVIILGDLGLNLAPVLASAGVLGVAIGFGAQNLVKDFLAGIFMLLEDQYGVGDVINIGDITGTVEGVSLRITRLRDVNGVAWYIRNGTIKQTGNESQSWARAVVDFPVPYDRDVAVVREVMQQATSSLWQDASWQGVLLEAPEVWGIQELSGESVVMRVTARTAPLRQWDVARELRERLKNSLDAWGAMAVASAGAPGRTAGDRPAPPDGAAPVSATYSGTRHGRDT